MLCYLIVLSLAAQVALGQTYAVSTTSGVHILDSCGAVTTTVPVVASNLQAVGALVYYQTSSSLYSLMPNGTSTFVCSACLPPTPWVIEGSTVIGYGATGITTRAVGDSSGSTAYAPAGSNIVKSVAVAGSVVYWIENVPGGGTELWAASFPAFSGAAKNAAAFSYPFTSIVGDATTMYVSVDGHAASFEPRSSADQTVRSISAVSYPAGLTLAKLAPAGTGWAAAGTVSGAGAVAAGISGCTKNVTTALSPAPADLAVFASPQECPNAPCWQVPATVTTSAASRPSPTWALVGVAALVSLFM